jgi:predicted secreted hydrolase
MRRRVLLSRALGTLAAYPWAGSRPLHAQTQTVDYPQISPATILRFPRDHGAHPAHRIEWWYVTGWFDTQPKPTGFQVTFFRLRPGVAENLQSPLAAQQLVFAHAAVSDASLARLLKAEAAARVGIGAQFSTEDLLVTLNQWQMQRLADDRMIMRVRAPQFAFDLTATPTQPFILQGANGFSQKGPDPRLASHYVSWPQLNIKGSLTLEGSTRSVSGRAWFDHEWSSEVLGDAGVGWDWIGINLADGGALMAFRIRDALGQPVYAHAMHRSAQGVTTQYTPGQVQWIPIRRWTSPASGASYPVELEIRIGEHNLRLMPLIDNQELITRRTGQVTYWEGLVDMSGSLAGRGYLELTGYAGKLDL